MAISPPRLFESHSTSPFAWDGKNVIACAAGPRWASFQLLTFIWPAETASASPLSLPHYAVPSWQPSGPESVQWSVLHVGHVWDTSHEYCIGMWQASPTDSAESTRA